MPKTNQISNEVKKIIFVFSLLPFLLLAGFTLAADECPPGQVCIENPLQYKEFETLLGAITNFILKLALVVAPIMLIISGFLFVTSAGDPARVQTAKKLALYTIIGFIIILFASGLVAVLKSIIGYQGP